jgi:hypothetical protein
MQGQDDWEILKQLIVENTVFTEFELQVDNYPNSPTPQIPSAEIQPSCWSDSTPLSPASSLSSSSSSLEEIIVCPYFLQGKCKFKGKCTLLHHIDECPYCHSKMPSGKLASSTHLGRCWKKFNPKNHKSS